MATEVALVRMCTADTSTPSDVHIGPSVDTSDGIDDVHSAHGVDVSAVYIGPSVDTSDGIDDVHKVKSKKSRPKTLPLVVVTLSRTTRSRNSAVRNHTVFSFERESYWRRGSRNPCVDSFSELPNR
jgi:hypothetical protein